MVAKKREGLLYRAIKGAISKVGESVEGLKEEIEETIDSTKKKIHEVTESLFAHIMVLFLVMSGLIFLFLGATYKIMQGGIDRGSAFLIMGVLILILGWIFLIKLRQK